MYQIDILYTLDLLHISNIFQLKKEMEIVIIHYICANLLCSNRKLIVILLLVE